jgi:hypothetical protein
VEFIYVFPEDVGWVFEGYQRLEFVHQDLDHIGFFFEEMCGWKIKGYDLLFYYRPKSNILNYFFTICCDAVSSCVYAFTT